MRTLLLISVVCLTLFSGCKDNEEIIIDVNTTQPEIIKLSSSASEIVIAGVAILDCEATGGNLQYTWEVLLGDIIPLNEEGSMVQYSGSECCVGEKEITCTVKNDKGEDKEVITITIIDQ